MDQEEQYEKIIIKYIEESAKLLHYVGASLGIMIQRILNILLIIKIIIQNWDYQKST